MATTGFKKAIYDRLNADTGITLSVVDRIYPELAPKSDALPYITLHRVSNNHLHHLSGAAGLVTQRYQIDCWASDSVTLETLSEAVRNNLDGFEHGSWGTVDVKDVKLSSENDQFIQPTDASEVGVFRTSMDFTIWHAESMPTN